MNINELLHFVIEHNASDLHLSSGLPPIIRVDGDLQYIDGHVKFSEEDLIKILPEIVPVEYQEGLNTQLDLDFSFDIPDLSRFRVNVFRQQRGISIALRSIPIQVPTFESLGLPQIFYKLCDLPNGLILITGPTGCGKTTTLAAMINYINETKLGHILTIEDPIEYIHDCKKSLIQQREVRKHVVSFDVALRAALREDPDYILVGEMRDLETVKLALTAAETGHLVLATLHTRSSADTIDRIIDVFPTFEKAMIRTMLAGVLQAVISQVLVKRTNGGRIAAQEIMLCSTAIRNLIRENKVPQIYSVIQTGREKGMQTMAQAMQDLTAKQIIPLSDYQRFLNNVL